MPFAVVDCEIRELCVVVEPGIQISSRFGNERDSVLCLLVWQRYSQQSERRFPDSSDSRLTCGVRGCIRRFQRWRAAIGVRRHDYGQSQTAASANEDVR